MLTFLCLLGFRESWRTGEKVVPPLHGGILRQLRRSQVRATSPDSVVCDGLAAAGFTHYKIVASPEAPASRAHRAAVTQETKG